MLLLSDGWKTARYYKSSTGKTEIIDEVEVRVDGKFRYKNSKKEIFATMSGVYPQIGFTINGKRRVLSAHVVIISTFYKTPIEKGIVIDHIDRNSKNINIDNLRFVSQSENLRNRASIKRRNMFVIFDYNGNLKSNISSQNNTIYDAKKYMDSTDTIYIFSEDSFYKLKESLLRFGMNYINSLTWKEFTKNHYISEIGLIKNCCRRTQSYTFGTLGPNGYYYYDCSLINHSRLVHILVAEIFLNKGNKILDGLVIDHIDTNRQNNSVSNLRIVSMKENMNNSNTCKKAMLPVKCLNKNETIYFKSLSDCANILKMNTPGSICDWVKGRHSCILYPDLTNFQYVSQDEILNNNIKFIESFEELDLPEIIPRMIKSREEMIKFINDNKLTCKKDFINNGLENFYNSFVKRFPPIVYYKNK